MDIPAPLGSVDFYSPFAIMNPLPLPPIAEMAQGVIPPQVDMAALVHDEGDPDWLETLPDWLLEFVALNTGDRHALLSLRATSQRTRAITAAMVPDTIIPTQEALERRLAGPAEPGVRWLYLREGAFCSRDLRALLLHFPNLQRISSSDTVTITGLNLRLAGTHLNDAILEWIGTHTPMVRIADFAGTNVTDAGIEAFVRQQTHLVFVNLSRTTITDRSLQAIAAYCHELMFLDISHTETSIAGVSVLFYAIPNIGSITLAHTRVTIEELGVLIAEHPKLSLRCPPH